jgi:hypothetical protein
MKMLGLINLQIPKGEKQKKKKKVYFEKECP